MRDQFRHHYSSKVYWFWEHFFFIVIPIAILLAQPDNRILQYSMLIGSIIYMVIISRLVKVNLMGIGLSSKYFKEALRYLSLPTIAISVVLMIARKFAPGVFVVSNYSPLQYIFISVPLQELLFRGFCLWRCQLSYKNHTFIVIFNSLVFASYHIIFHNIYLVIGIFLLNLFWSKAFFKYPNLFAFMISHAIIGSVYFL